MDRRKNLWQRVSRDRAPATELVDIDVVAPVTVDRKGDQKADDADYVYTQTRVIEIPPRAFERGRVITGRAHDAVTRAYKLLRTQVLQRLAAEAWQTIAVVSPAAGDGKTLTAISIASTRTHSALLVDLDWRQPSVHSYFDYWPQYDLCDYLHGAKPLENVLVNPSVPRFCFLPCRDTVDDSSEQLQNLGGFVKELKGRYGNRIVLFDLPPLFATDDAIGFLPLVDCALLVIEEGKTRREDIGRAISLIGEDRLLGTVMNKSRQRLPAY
jgi:Mrp family chromosome partitioning ATPase